jgi:hypothetical protein
MLLTVNLAGLCDLLTSMSGESPISPKLLLTDCAPEPSTMAEITDTGSVVAVATPSATPFTEPGLVMPFTVLGGCVGSVTL